MKLRLKGLISVECIVIAFIVLFAIDLKLTYKVDTYDLVGIIACTASAAFILGEITEMMDD